PTLRSDNGLRLSPPQAGAPRSRRIGGTLPPPHLSWCGTRQPRCGLAPGPVSRTIFGRTAHAAAGTGWPKKRTPPAERQGEAITRWIGPAGPRRKAADVGRVSHPKYGVREANRGTSWMPSSGEANGPEGRAGTDWDAIDWRQADRIIRN